MFQRKGREHALYFQFTRGVNQCGGAQFWTRGSVRRPGPTHMEISVSAASIVWSSGELQCGVPPEAWMEYGQEKATLTQTQHVSQTWYLQAVRLDLSCMLK